METIFTELWVNGGEQGEVPEAGKQLFGKRVTTSFVGIFPQLKTLKMLVAQLNS